MEAAASEPPLPAVATHAGDARPGPARGQRGLEFGERTVKTGRRHEAKPVSRMDPGDGSQHVAGPGAAVPARRVSRQPRRPERRPLRVDGDHRPARRLRGEHLREVVGAGDVPAPVERQPSFGLTVRGHAAELPREFRRDEEAVGPPRCARGLHQRRGRGLNIGGREPGRPRHHPHPSDQGRGAARGIGNEDQGILRGRPEHEPVRDGPRRRCGAGEPRLANLESAGVPRLDDHAGGVGFQHEHPDDGILIRGVVDLHGMRHARLQAREHDALPGGFA